jgi:hypothetical protein
MPVSEFGLSPARVSPVAGETGLAIARGLSRGRGGIFAAIGGAIAAVLGGIFGRKKES